MISRQSFNFRRKQSGLSLIEVMIGAVLSLVLLAGIIQIVLANKTTYRVQEGLSRLQENGRFALQFLSYDIRMAGFLGCVGVDNGLEFTNNVAPAGTGGNGYSGNQDAMVQGFDGKTGVQGYHYDGSTLPTKLSDIGLTTGTGFGALVANTDVLLITRGGSCRGGAVLSHNNNSAQLKIEDNGECQVQQNDILMVSNCRTADMFGVSNNPGDGASATIAHGANWNKSPQLENGYGPDSDIFRIRNMAYYIGNGKSGEPSLFRRELVSGTFQNQELVENIESMDLLYGEDRTGDGNADVYVAAASVVDMQNVVGVRATLVARTTDKIASKDLGSGDKRIRKTFASTIAIRNKTN